MDYLKLSYVQSFTAAKTGNLSQFSFWASLLLTLFIQTYNSHQKNLTENSKSKRGENYFLGEAACGQMGTHSQPASVSMRHLPETQRTVGHGLETAVILVGGGWGQGWDTKGVMYSHLSSHIHYQSLKMFLLPFLLFLCMDMVCKIYLQIQT